MEIVRLRFNWSDVKKAIESEYNIKFKEGISSDKRLNRQIADDWALRVTQFVPRSDKNGAHHLQEFTTTNEGRVIWHKSNRYGQEIAKMLYNGAGRGHWHQRTEILAGAKLPHQPQDYWDQAVRPGTPEWDSFIDGITPSVLARFEWIAKNK